MTIGRSIQAHRKKRNLTIRQLGALSGVSAGTIGNYERGVTVPKRRTLEKIARALDIPPEKLLPEPEMDLPAVSRNSDALLYDGVLALLKARYGAMEGRTVVGEGGRSRRYYVVRQLPEDFVLHEEDVAAIARSARDALSPLLARLYAGETA